MRHSLYAEVPHHPVEPVESTRLPRSQVSEFEYITVLFSIILGLAVTQLLSGFARLLRDGHSLLPAWWIFVLIATLLLTDFQVWWVSFIWRGLPQWTFFSYAAFMILPMLLYLMAYLVLPNDLRLDGRELAQEFIARRKPFYACLVLVPLASFFQQRMLSGHPPGIDLDTGFRLLLLALAFPGFLSRRTRVQAAVATLALLTMAAYVSLLFVRLR